MSATNTTTHYNLPSFVATDKPAWLVDWNGAMASIDAGIYQAQQTADTNTSDISSVQGSVTTLAGTVESQGLTISTLSQSLTTAIGNINTINSLIGNGTPTTTDQTIIGAINEINARTGEAEGISYDNTDSGLSATNVQGAIDKNAEAIATLNSSLNNLSFKIYQGSGTFIDGVCVKTLSVEGWSEMADAIAFIANDDSFSGGMLASLNSSKTAIQITIANQTSGTNTNNFTIIAIYRG